MNPFWAALVAAFGLLPSDGVSELDLRWLPSDGAVEYWYPVIMEHLRHAEVRVALSPSCQHTIHLRDELLRRKYVWETLADAQSQMRNHCPFWAKVSLYQLRDMLGKDAYALGNLPHPIPYHLYEDATGTPFPKYYDSEADPDESPLPRMEKLP